MFYRFHNLDEREKTQFILDLFLYQSSTNLLYEKFINYLNIDPNSIKNIEDIPFLPVSFYKTNVSKSGQWEEEIIFESSSTTGMIPSKHFIRDVDFYLKNTIHCFSELIGNPEDYCFFALLPSYHDRKGSSLIYMVEHFMKISGCGKFYNKDYQSLISDIKSYKGSKKKVLFGVTFALLRLAEMGNLDLSDVMIFETGGMKGRGKELHRNEVHDILIKSFNVAGVYSEYGMTELLSQAYSDTEAIFRLPSTMRLLISDIYDPFSFLENGKQGKINIIDLANIDTCSFLATDDLGVKLDKNRFKVLGRTDESDVRGCNLLFY
ncbi:MAG TPA: acyl transferase [Bacteroidetes bacterium]|nr:acyl transferase [Bacteroidota bacterium]